MKYLSTNHPLPAPAACNSGRQPSLLHALYARPWVLGVLLLFGGFPTVKGQTTLHTGAANFVSLIRGANFPVTDPVTYNAVEMATSAGNLLYVDQDASLQSGGSFSIFTSMSWVAASRVSASLLGTDEMTTPVDGRKLIVRNLALSNVDLNADNVQLGFQPPSGDSSLTLDNASLTGQFTPFLYTLAHFNLNASGTSAISNWSGNRSSVTTLNVASGGSLRIKDCGDVASVSLSDMLYFAEFQNRAVISGGTLLIDHSAVVFGRKDSLAEPANESVMTFSNNATLQMEGSTPYTKLETDRMVFQNSTLNLSNHLTRLNVRLDLQLDNSAAFIADGARVSAVGVVVTNSSTVALAGNTAQGIVTDFLDINSGATLTLLGPGVEDGELTVNSRVYFPKGAGVGTIHVTDRTYLTMAGGSIMDLDAHGILTTTPISFIVLQDAALNLFAAGTFTNSGYFTVQSPSALNALGNARIAGAGSITLQGALDFTLGSPTNRAKNSLTTGNKLEFNSTAVVHMTLDPTGLTCDRLICSNSIDLNSKPALNLSVVNDQPLSPGTKFCLMDYRDYQGEFTILGRYSRFAGYTNMSYFNLGLNTYQIRYDDSTYQPGSQQFVTLTVVANPECRVLNLSKQGANALLWWSANCNLFQLEATYTLSSNTNSNPAIWTPVSGNPVLIGGQWIVSVPIEATNRFFRLRLP